MHKLDGIRCTEIADRPPPGRPEPDPRPLAGSRDVVLADDIPACTSGRDMPMRG